MARGLLLAMIVALLAAPSFAQAKRVALVIGNGAYVTAGRLVNAQNDMALVSTALKQAGFTTVTTRTDLSTQNFQKALREFQTQADGAEVALIYYAGHGIEAKGVNWLIPVDATLSDRSLQQTSADPQSIALSPVPLSGTSGPKASCATSCR